MDDKLDSIIQKIKGLMALAEDKSNENEAQSALLMAQRLMVKYNVDQSVVDESKDKKDENVVEEHANEFKKLHWYERKLACIISDNFRVKNYLTSRRYKKRIEFYGLEKDVKIAKEMYELMIAVINFYAKKFIEEFYEKNYHLFREHKQTISIKSAYISGFLEGLETKLEEQRFSLQEEYGLVVLMPVIVNEKYNEMVEKEFSDEGSSFKMPKIEDFVAYLKGYEDGEKIDYTRATIDGEDKEL